MLMADEFPTELVERCTRAILSSCDAQAVLREIGYAELISACVESRKLGMKIYHNANAHEAPKDWATVKKMLESALAKAGVQC